MIEQDGGLPRILVYGSCVARDTVEVVRDRVDLQAYVARQSLLSAASDASAHLPADAGLESSFQTRMVSDDFAGTLDAALAHHAGRVDLLLWDLADERHGVHRFADGSIVTRSVDTMRSETMGAVLASSEHIPFGSDEHFRLWHGAAQQLVERLGGLHLLDRTVLLDIPWAELTTYGDPAPWSMGMRAKEANVLFARYYDALERLGVRTVSLRDADVRADPEHRWGAAPFHYAPDVYRSVLQHLARGHGVPTLGDLPGTSPKRG